MAAHSGGMKIKCRNFHEHFDEAIGAVGIVISEVAMAVLVKAIESFVKFVGFIVSEQIDELGN